MPDLSDALGYTSIACWLGAQFPQVIENYRRQSVEGLALSFLANWLFGDITNLVGCILTHQLPFQTYLAGYFVFVDFSLLSQYFYYTRLKPPPKPSYVEHPQRPSRFSHDREVSRYRTLSAVASNVAAAAALAATGHRRGATDDPRRLSPSALEEDDEVDEQALAALADSFHSEGGGRMRRKRVSWSRERRLSDRAGSLGRHAPTMSPILSMSPVAPDTLVRGRTRDRPDERDDAEEGSAQERRSSRASRRGAGIVFLAVWALFGVGTLAGRNMLSARELRVGRVLAADAAASAIVSHMPVPAAYYVDTVEQTYSTIPPPSTPGDRPPPHDREPPASTERIIGRIFAWACTTLYLTSRLPQIWKNYVRKSAEGLSVFLFIFAFLGNFFYVASILTSPNLQQPEPAASDFLRESIPYLLGSGGTLMFDVTIVTQTIIYRPRRYAGSLKTAEEETGLLNGDSLAESGELPRERERTRSSTRR